MALLRGYSWARLRLRTRLSSGSVVPEVKSETDLIGASKLLQAAVEKLPEENQTNQMLGKLAVL